MKLFTLSCGLLLSMAAFANTTLPRNCKAMAVTGETLILQAKKTDLILIHNLTPTDLWITHPVTRVGASAGWASRLQSGHWSALVNSKKNFELQCIESKPGHEQQIPCEGAIAVARWKGAKIPDGKGSYWAAEDMSLSALKAALGARGIKLP